MLFSWHDTIYRIRSVKLPSSYFRSAILTSHNQSPTAIVAFVLFFFLFSFLFASSFSGRDFFSFWFLLRFLLYFFFLFLFSFIFSFSSLWRPTEHHLEVISVSNDTYETYESYDERSFRTLTIIWVRGLLYLNDICITRECIFTICICACACVFVCRILKFSSNFVWLSSYSTRI